MSRSSLSETAEYFDTTAKTFAREAREKGYPFVIVGKRMKFDIREVELHLAATRVEPKPGVVRQFVKREKKNSVGMLAARLGL